MRHGRWIAAVTGLVAVAALTAPAGAGVKTEASNKAIFRAGVVTAADAPQGWTGQKQSGATSSYKGFPDCKYIAAAVAAVRKSPHVLSPAFSDPNAPNATSAENAVYAFKSVSAAEQNVAAFQASSAVPCLQEAATKGVGNAQAQITVTPFNAQGVGDANAGLETTLTGTTQSGQPVKVVLDLIAVGVGRAFVGFTFSNPNERLPQAAAIVSGVVDRLKAVNA